MEAHSCCCLRSEARVIQLAPRAPRILAQAIPQRLCAPASPSVLRRGGASPRRTAIAATEQGPVTDVRDDAVDPSSVSQPATWGSAISGLVKLPGVLSILAYSGAWSGTLLDGIHSRMGLQVYDTAPLVLGGLKTSAAVPPLLGVFWVVLGALTYVTDTVFAGSETEAAQRRSADASYVALGFGVLAALLHLSAVMYDEGVPYWQIHLVLGSAAAANWKLFDGTRQVLLISVACALGAPLAEVLLNALLPLPLWHYPRADLGGVLVSWVPWCYFFYVPAVANLTRHTLGIEPPKP